MYFMEGTSSLLIYNKTIKEGDRDREGWVEYMYTK